MNNEVIHNLDQVDTNWLTAVLDDPGHKNGANAWARTLDGIRTLGLPFRSISDDRSGIPFAG